jgi:beta-mannosidase
MARSVEALSREWQAAWAPADGDPAELDWIPARVPGTAAGALRDAGRWQPGEPRDLDGEEWWFRTSFDARPLAPGEEAVLHLDGIATVAEVHLNGEPLLQSESMFEEHALSLGERLREHNELTIRCRALAPLLAESRRPRARWRTRLVGERNLRFFRTMLLGRAPGFAPGPAVVGPWREVWLERRKGVVVEELALRPRVDGRRGVLSVAAQLRSLDGAAIDGVEVELSGPSGTHHAELRVRRSADVHTADGEPAVPHVDALAGQPTVPHVYAVAGELAVPDVERWWPHTHGLPALHDVRLLVGGAHERIAIDAGRVGFRELAFGETPNHEIERDGIDLHVNGVRAFVRGAVWTPLDPVGMAPSERQLRAALVQVREAGMNMVRLPGTAAYETRAFHDLCDELGIFVWQDFMFANFDYPLAHEPFRASIVREARQTLDALAGRPSLAVVCGNSEVEQQVAMLGLDPALGRGELFGELLPRLVGESGVDAAYVPSAPCGGELPFRPDRGIANYFGVGGYRRPLEDARRAGVRFAAECLAFANVPSAGPFEPVPRDAGEDWDFADVRDHYLRELFDVDPHELRDRDSARYLELARATTGEVMAEVFGEWRREGSPCGGALVLWLRDLLPGSGWGVIDHRGVPKLAYHHLRRALAPVAVWTVDEGLGGIVAHVANDAPQPLHASLRVALYRGELCVEQALTPLALAPHSQGEWNVEGVLGHFVDASWAYRFGPPAQDAIVVSLEQADPHEPAAPGEAGSLAEADAHRAADRQVLCQTVRFPAGRPIAGEPPELLGCTVESALRPDGSVRLVVASRRLAYGMRIDAPGYVPSDDGFFVEPGGTHTVILTPTGPDASLERATIGALNMAGRLALAAEVLAL